MVRTEALRMMNSLSLQSAIDGLEILDVYIENLVCNIADDFYPKYDPDVEKYEIQFKHFVRQSSIAEFEQDGKILRVTIDLGVRWINTNKSEEEKAKIEASYVVEYKIINELTDEAIEEFSLKNASYHVWPYWRELVSTNSEKMRLPRFMMPTVQFAANNIINKDDEETDN